MISIAGLGRSNWRPPQRKLLNIDFVANLFHLVTEAFDRFHPLLQLLDLALKFLNLLILLARGQRRRARLRQ